MPATQTIADTPRTTYDHATRTIASAAATATARATAAVNCQQGNPPIPAALTTQTYPCHDYFGASCLISAA